MALELNNYSSLRNDANLRAYYRFSTGALTTDSSSNGYTLTNNNGVADGTGMFGGGADFGNPNTTKSMTISNNLGIAGNGDISVSFWIKLNAEIGTGGLEVFWIHKSTTTSDKLMQMYYQESSGTRYLYIDSVIGYAVNLSTTWHYIVATRTGGTVELYIDGVSRGSATSATGAGGANSFCIGAQNATPDFPSSAIIDDMTVFSRVLTATEITNYYNAVMGSGFFNFF